MSRIVALSTCSEEVNSTRLTISNAVPVTERCHRPSGRRIGLPRGTALLLLTLLLRSLDWTPPFVRAFVNQQPALVLASATETSGRYPVMSYSLKLGEKAQNLNELSGKGLLLRVPTTFETACLQLRRLFQYSSPYDAISRSERVIRIVISWLLLLGAKCVALASPLFFKSLIEQANLADTAISQSGSVLASIQVSALGMAVGYGASRIASGFVQLVSELILAPVTTYSSEILPREAFIAALRTASRRIDEGKRGSLSTVDEISSVGNASPSTPSTNTTVGDLNKADGTLGSTSIRLRKGTNGNISDGRTKHFPTTTGAIETEASDEKEKGKVSQARRALDKGLKASNDLLYRVVFNLFPAFVESICVLVLIFRSADAIVGATAGVVAYFFVAVTSLIMGQRIKLLRAQLAAERTANGYADDALALAETVAAFDAAFLEEQRYSQALRQVSYCSLKVRRSFSFLKIVQALIMGTGSAVLMFAAWQSQDPHPILPSLLRAAPGTTSIGVDGKSSTLAGTLILVQALFAQLCAPLDRIGQHIRDCASAAENLRELEELKTSCMSMDAQFAVPKNVRDDLSPDTQFDYSVAATSSDANMAGTSQQLLEGCSFSLLQGLPQESNAKLEIRDLYFTYPTPSHTQQERGRFILSNVSFVLPTGGYSLGIVGPSGSGKSTLLRVLLGLESITGLSSIHKGLSVNTDIDCGTRGRVFIGGRDVSAYNRVPFFAMVGQDSDLFRGLNLKDNIRYGVENLIGYSHVTELHSEAALQRAAADAQLLPVVAKLKDGWESSVGPRGRLLSGGERQRACLARALYRQELGGGILLMDEVTASLDAKTESIVTNAIMSRVNRGATAILIAHRLSSVQQCDRIVVMRDGEIVEDGTHDELMQKGGWYAESWRLQSATQ